MNKETERIFAQLSEEAKQLFEESITCYKFGIHRASYLMSYLAFLVTLKERIFCAERPDGYTKETWMELRKKIDDDELWEDAILEELVCKKKFDIQEICVKDSVSLEEIEKELDKTDLNKLKNEMKNKIGSYCNMGGNRKQKNKIKITIEVKNLNKTNVENNLFNIRNRAGFEKEFTYFRNTRNKCAHNKEGVVESSTVEEFWHFMDLYLPKLRVEKTLEYWKEQLRICYRDAL